LSLFFFLVSCPYAHVYVHFFWHLFFSVNLAICHRYYAFESRFWSVPNIFRVLFIFIVCSSCILQKKKKKKKNWWHTS
jgi:hypothetical protein